LQEKKIDRLGGARSLEIDVRIIAATNQDLERAVSDGRFRQDLYYRLNVFPVRVPPLRERVEDIPLLAWAFVEEFAKAMNKHIESISEPAMHSLMHYSWPGNVRELRNVIERAMILSSGPKLRVELPGAGQTLSVSASQKVSDVEREHILTILGRTGWRIRGKLGAAEMLGLKPTTLESRMVKLGIQRPSR